MFPRNCENSAELGVFLSTKTIFYSEVPSDATSWEQRMDHDDMFQTRLMADAFPNPGASFLPTGERIVAGAYFRKSRRTDWPTIPIRNCIRTSNTRTPPFASHFFRSPCELRAKRSNSLYHKAHSRRYIDHHRNWDKILKIGIRHI